MHDRDDILLGEGARKCRFVGDVAGDQRARDEALVAGRKIVVADGAIARGVQRPATM
jgi:hypothetical protein